MARGRPQTNAGPTTPETEIDEQDETPAENADLREEVVDMGGPRAEALLRDTDSFKRLPDPAQGPQQRADATKKNRREAEHELASARALGGASFAALEQRLRRAKEAFVEAPKGADLPALQEAYRAAKHEHDEAAARYAEQASEKARVRHFTVLDNSSGKGKLAQTSGSHGRARLHPGKVIDTLNYDVEALKRQGIKLEEIEDSDDERAA